MPGVTDAIGATLRRFGSKPRSATATLAAIASGELPTPMRPSVRGARPASETARAASTLLGTMYAEAAAHGQASLPRAPRTSANSIELLVRNEQYLPRLYSDLERAKRSVTITQFNFEPDGGGRRVADILKARAQAGVDVRIIVDGYGFGQVGKQRAAAFERELVDSGIKIIKSRSPLQLGHDGWEHRKLIVIDDDVLFTGGLGFGEKYDSWTDVMARITGPTAAVAASNALASWRDITGSLDPAARSRLQVVSSRLQQATGPTLAARGASLLKTADEPTASFGTPIRDARAGVHLLENRPGSDLAATEAFLRDAQAAKHRFWATSTYITSSDAARALADAARRGIDVRLLVTGMEAGNDVKQIRLAHTLYDEMLEAGVKIGELPTVLHAKTWVRDDDVAAVGSMNLSRSSMARSRETTARVEDPQFTRSVAEFFTTTEQRTKPVRPHQYDSPSHAIINTIRRVTGFEF
jgi:cardiolipin synthase